MFLIEAKAVTQRNRILARFDSDRHPQIIRSESMTTLLVEVDDRTIAC